MSNGRFYINLGGTIGDIGAVRYGFRAPKDSYKNIGNAMGVKEATDTTPGVFYGAQSPRPAKVRISYKKGLISALTGDAGNSLASLVGSVVTGSVTRFCEPDKVGDVTVGKVLNSLKVKVGLFEYQIDSVNIAGSR